MEESPNENIWFFFFSWGKRTVKLPICREYFLNVPFIIHLLSQLTSQGNLSGNTLRNANSLTLESVVVTCVKTYLWRKLNGRNILDGHASDLISFLPCGISHITKHIIILWNSFSQDPREWESGANNTHRNNGNNPSQIIWKSLQNAEVRYKSDSTSGN